MNMKQNRQILDIIRANDTEHYDGIIAGMDDWQISYHLGSLRTAFLSCFVSDGERALEVGAGYGALTGMLLDHFDTVYAMESAQDCIEGLQTRFRNRRNLKIIAETETDRKYDLILAVDCLDRPHTDREKTLRELKGLLTDNGILICNLHNRLGVRYLCGGQDAYVRQPFLIYRPDALLCRTEMDRMLTSVLKENFDMYMPVPDSSFCQMLFSDQDLPVSSIRDRLFSYDPFGSSQVIYEPDLYDDLLRQGVFSAFANEYLVVYHNGTRPDNRMTSAVISADRERSRAYRTVFHDDKTVTKTALYPEGTESLFRMYGNMETLRSRGVPVIEQAWENDHVKMPRYELPSLQNCLLSIAREGAGRLEQTFDDLYEMVLQSSEIIRTDEHGPVLETGYIDMIPLNIFYNNGEYLYFDQEFTLPECPAAYILYRAVLYAWLLIPELEQIYPRQKMEERFHLTAYLHEYKKTEDAFVGRNRQWRTFGQYYRWQNQPQHAEEHRRLLKGKPDHD